MVTKDIVIENLDTIDLTHQGSWFTCGADRLMINLSGVETDLEKEGVRSGFLRWIAEGSPMQAPSVLQYEIPLPINFYRIQEHPWLSNRIVYPVGTIYPGVAEKAILDSTAINFVSAGDGVFSIGCPITIIKNELQLPEHIETRLQKIKELREKWDSYSAKKISSKMIEKAKSLLIEASARCGSDILDDVFIAPCSDGCIQLEWTTESETELIVKIRPSLEKPAFLLSTPSGEEDGIIKYPEDWNGLLREFCEPKV